MTLEDTKTNHEYIIQEINIDKCTKARLQILGILKGTTVRILNKRNNGSLIIKIRGTRLGIDKEIAKAISVCRGKHSSSISKIEMNYFQGGN